MIETVDTCDVCKESWVRDPKFGPRLNQVSLTIQRKIAYYGDVCGDCAQKFGIHPEVLKLKEHQQPTQTDEEKMIENVKGILEYLTRNEVV